MTVREFKKKFYTTQQIFLTSVSNRKRTMQEEIWKDIPGYEGFYQVSNFGIVRSLDKFVRETGGKSRIMRSAILKLFLTKGYLRCGLTINKNQRIYYVHQLVAMAFLNYKPNGRFIVVDHINNIKTDNRLENLQVISQRHNASKDKKERQNTLELVGSIGIKSGKRRFR